MKRIAVLVLSVALLMSFSGCGTLIRACTGLGGQGSSSPPPRTLHSQRVSVAEVNAELGGLYVTDAIDGMDSSLGYTYGDGYEYFTFKKDGAVELSVTVVPIGKDIPSGVSPPGGGTVESIGGMEVRYGVTRRRFEDYYSFKTQALITCGGDTAIVFYDYSSRSAQCELIGLVTALFEAKE